MDDLVNATLIFNGVDAETGRMTEMPIGTADFDLSRDLSGWQRLERAGFTEDERGETRGTVEDIEGHRVAEAGWGIIFPCGPSQEIQHALMPLIELRASQCGDRFRIFSGDTGYQPGETADLWLSRMGVWADGPVDPRDGVPWYLLLVGSPVAIPFSVQHDLGVRFAVGRLYFENLADYADYARSVCEAESRKQEHAPEAFFFGPENEGDWSTQMTREHLLEPLVDQLKGNSHDWKISTCLGSTAGKQRIQEVLGGSRPPALFFSVTHGLEYKYGHPEQQSRQGALVCSEWHRQWRGRLPESFYFSGEDVLPEMNLAGGIFWLFACHSGGDQGIRSPLDRSAQGAFLAGLPGKLLGHGKRGALAVVAHVDRSFVSSFFSKSAQQSNRTFSSVLGRLFRGYPVGFAMEYIGRRHAQLALRMLRHKDYRESGLPVAQDAFLSDLMMYQDMRHYIILGDPAVRIPQAEV